MASLTIENYVKTIYQICVGQTKKPAATGQLASALGVSPGTVTSMLKTLGESGLAEYTRYEGVRLTDSGHKLALRVLRRHRLIELFLAHTLDLPWDEVHEEAEHMEHAVSDRLIDRIDMYLGHPSTDPHGDPIPKADGTIESAPSHSLAEAPVGNCFRLVRVLDQSPEFLRYLSETGLPLGARGEVAANRLEAGVDVAEGLDETLRVGEQVLEVLDRKVVLEQFREIHLGQVFDLLLDHLDLVRDLLTLMDKLSRRLRGGCRVLNKVGRIDDDGARAGFGLGCQDREGRSTREGLSQHTSLHHSAAIEN